MENKISWTDFESFLPIESNICIIDHVLTKEIKTYVVDLYRLIVVIEKKYFFWVYWTYIENILLLIASHIIGYIIKKIVLSGSNESFLKKF